MQNDNIAKSSARAGRGPRSIAQQAIVEIFRTANALEAQFAALLEPSGLTPPQYNVLRILKGAGEPLPTMEIGNRMIHRTPGITRLIDRLEEAGLITRERSTEDRRQVFCSITDAGLTMLKRLDPVVDQRDESFLAILTRAEQKTLLELLELIRSKL